MAEMKRMAFVIDEDLERQILEMRKSDRFVRCSVSEIIRELVRRGLEATERVSGGAGEEEATP